MDDALVFRLSVVTVSFVFLICFFLVFGKLATRMGTRQGTNKRRVPASVTTSRSSFFVLHFHHLLQTKSNPAHHLDCIERFHFFQTRLVCNLEKCPVLLRDTRNDRRLQRNPKSLTEIVLVVEISRSCCRSRELLECCMAVLAANAVAAYTTLRSGRHPL